MKHYPVENVYLYTSRHLLLVLIQKSIALWDNCLVYSPVSNNYLGTNNCSVENNFHLLVNVLFQIALLLRMMYLWNIIQLIMSMYYASRHFHPYSYSEKQFFLRYLSCIQYLSSLNNYLGSNKCFVENNFHFLVNVLFPNALLFSRLTVWKIIQLRMSIFKLHVIFPLVRFQKSNALWDNCLVYSTSLISNIYLGSNKCSVDNRLHFSRECPVSICSSV